MFRQSMSVALSSSSWTSRHKLPNHANGGASVSRPVYVSRLRRAFLLRVHPDRFRSQPPSVRKEQANLVQALSDRLGDPDFLAFTTPSSSSDIHRNGSVSMNKSVDKDIVDEILRSAGFYGWGTFNQQSSKSYTSTGRNLFHFLKELDPRDIKERKLNRLNASAAALVARRAYHFSAVDGTGLGWSSSSLKICLSRLTSLHDEHGYKLRTKSFYPFRLVLTSDEFQRKVDLFGGVIRLNPAATSLQWLEILLSVTEKSVQTLKQNQKNLKRNLCFVEDKLGIRVVKGHSCEPKDYHRCVERLAAESGELVFHNQETALTIASNTASLVIEAEQACRRGRLRKDGNFEVGAGMTLDEIRRTIIRHVNASVECKLIESGKEADYKNAMDQVLYEFGLQRFNKVSSLVTSDQMLQCLACLLEKEEEEKDSLRRFLAGQTIGVTVRGQQCHIGDDGSIIMPWDFL